MTLLIFYNLFRTTYYTFFNIIVIFILNKHIRTVIKLFFGFLIQLFIKSFSSLQQMTLVTFISNNNLGNKLSH